MPDKFTGTLKLTKTKRGFEHKFWYTNPKGREVGLVVQPGERYYAVEEADGKSYAAEAEVNGPQVSHCVVPGKEAEPVIQAKNQNDSQKKSGSNQSSGNQAAYNMGNNYCSRRMRQGGAGSGDHNAPFMQKEVAWGRAPYNFVPYQDGLIMEPVTDEERVWQGRIICRLTALTPLLVSGVQKRVGDVPAICEFMKVNGRYVIPGTSLKGMLRSLMEILSYSGLRPVSKEKFFWRDVVGLRYRANFGDPNNINGGYLYRDGADYYVREAKVTRVEDVRLERVETGKRPREKSPAVYYFEKDTEAKRQDIDRKVYLRLIRQMTPDQESRLSKKIENWLKNGKDGLPVFFRKEGDRIVELGFCRYFRLQYRYSPYDLAWPKPSGAGDENWSDKIDDMALSIFGRVDGKARRGRIAIEACELNGSPVGKPQTVVLGEPKPTCVPFYLEQDVNRIEVDRSGNNRLTGKNCGMQTYNDKSSRLRGRKLYWHHAVNVDKFLPPNENKKAASQLLPLESGAEGRFVIHVDRLSDSELGCLFEALELRPESAHRLGMGKPMGYGSVRIEIEAAEIANVRQKYASLAARLEHANMPLMDAESRDKLRQKFRERVLAFINAKTGSKGQKDFYELAQIRALYLMLNWKDKPQAAEVSNMPLETCFKKHPLLPEPDDITRHKTCS